MVSARVRRRQVALAMKRGLSQRTACALVGIARSTLSYRLRRPVRDEELRIKLREYAKQHPRWGYRLMTALLRRGGLRVNAKRVWRLWKLEGLEQPRRRRKRRVRRERPEALHKGEPNQVWALDFMHDRCANGAAVRCLTIVDEGTRECLAIVVRASIRAPVVIQTLQQLIEERGRPRALRADNGPEFTSWAMCDWRMLRGIELILNQPGKPWQNGVNESFNGTLRAECLNAELFNNRHEAAVVIEAWRNHYNLKRPHSALGYRTPAEAFIEYSRSTNPNKTKRGSGLTQPVAR